MHTHIHAYDFTYTQTYIHTMYTLHLKLIFDPEVILKDPPLLSFVASNIQAPAD